jgi:hypothetical protein
MRMNSENTKARPFLFEICLLTGRTRRALKRVKVNKQMITERRLLQSAVENHSQSRRREHDSETRRADKAGE